MIDTSLIRYNLNKNNILVYNKQNYNKIKSIKLIKNKEYRFKNKSKISAHYKNRRINDINFRLICNLRSRLNGAIKNNRKAGSAVDDLGCSVCEFKIYLESKFETWMNWDNYGVHDYNRKTWHIDHIIPISSFNLENREELLKACHYTNLQPLLATDNLSKGKNIL